MTKRVLVASVVALFAFLGCSQQVAKPEVKPEANATEANATKVNKTEVSEAVEAPVEVQLVEEAVSTPHSMKEVAVETVQTVK